MFPFIPYFFSCVRIQCFQVVGKALSISKNIAIRCCLYLNAVWISFSNEMIWSIVDRSFLKPHCCLLNILFVSKYHTNLLFNIFSKSLHIVFERAIGLQFLGSVLFLFGLGMGIISTSLQLFGKSFVLQMQLYILFKIDMTSWGKFLISSKGMLSGPGLLLFFSSLIAVSISQLFIVLFMLASDFSIIIGIFSSSLFFFRKFCE